MIVTDLAVVVDNMIKGPVGLLRNGRFFADAKALQAMDRQEMERQQALFPTQDTIEAKQQQGVFGNLKLPW